MKVEVHCENCRKPFMARSADRKRGWGRFCSKSCKAKEQEKRTGQYANYKQSYSNYRDVDDIQSYDGDWDSHYAPMEC